MSVLKWKVNSSSNFSSFFIVMTITLSSKFEYSSVSSNITPLYFCSLNNIYFGHKEPIKKMSTFRVLGSNFVKFMSVLKWKVSSSSIFVSFFIAMTHNTSVNFKVIPFLLWTKGSHQSPNFNTFKCSGENLPNFSSLFSNHKSVFLQNLHISSVSWKITPLYFCSSNNIYFGHKEPIKKIFLDFSSARVKFCNWGSCHF